MGGKTAGETPDPHFLFNRSVSEAYPVATELLQGRWPLVIGQASRELRLTALGMKDFTVLLADAQTLSIAAGSST